MTSQSKSRTEYLLPVGAWFIL